MRILFIHYNKPLFYLNQDVPLKFFYKNTLINTFNSYIIYRSEGWMSGLSRTLGKRVQVHT
jgi:hypothetical protein